MQPAEGDLGSVSWGFNEKLVRGRTWGELKLDLDETGPWVESALPPENLGLNPASPAPACRLIALIPSTDNGKGDPDFAERTSGPEGCRDLHPPTALEDFLSYRQ